MRAPLVVRRHTSSERLERGKKPDYEALCASHPEHESDLRELAALQRFADDLAGRAPPADEGVLQQTRGCTDVRCRSNLHHAAQRNGQAQRNSGVVQIAPAPYIHPALS